MPGIADLHPYQSDDTVQGMLDALRVAANPGRDRRPARRFAATGGGAQGELTALLVAAAYFREKQNAQVVLFLTVPMAQTPPAPPWPVSKP